MAIRVNGIEAQEFAAEVKAVHQLMPTRIKAESFYTACVNSIYCGKSLTRPEEITARRQSA
jgi:hypothetical protein